MTRVHKVAHRMRDAVDVKSSKLCTSQAMILTWCMSSYGHLTLQQVSSHEPFLLYSLACQKQKSWGMKLLRSLKNFLDQCSSSLATEAASGKSQKATLIALEIWLSTLIIFHAHWKCRPMTPLLSHLSGLESPGRVWKVSSPSEEDLLKMDGNKFWQEAITLES